MFFCPNSYPFILGASSSPFASRKGRVRFADLDLFASSPDVEGYPGQIIALLVVSGLIYLRWKEPDRKRPIKAFLPAILFYLVVSIFLLVVPFLRPPGGVGDTPPLPYWLYPVVGIAVFVSGFSESNPADRGTSLVSRLMHWLFSLLGSLANRSTQAREVQVGGNSGHSRRWYSRHEGQSLRSSQSIGRILT